MNSVRFGLAVAASLLILATAQAKLMVAPPPSGMRIASADLVVVGKVTALADKAVKGEMFKGDQRDMQVATVEVSDTVLGGKVKKVEVGFFPPVMNNGGGPRIRPIPGVQLQKDEEYGLILVKHPTKKDVYVVANFYDAMPMKGNPGFAKEIETLKKSAKLLDKPLDGLKSKDADERLTTAALLITRYRNQRGEKAKTEEIPAEESKLILEALASAEWAPKNAKFGEVMPQQLFFSLGVTAKDGWTFPKDRSKLAEEAKKWCKDNAGKYRISRFVNETKEEK